MSIPSHSGVAVAPLIALAWATSTDELEIPTRQAGEQLLTFRREIASHGVINVYWTTSKEMRYRLFDYLEGYDENCPIIEEYKRA